MRQSTHASVVYNNLMWVIGGWDGSYKNDVWHSSDGITWIQATAAAAFPPRDQYTSFVYNNLMWIIGGNSNTSPYYLNDVWYSSDGVIWTQATAAASFSGRDFHTSVVYNGMMWVIAGWNSSMNRINDVWHSP